MPKARKNRSAEAPERREPPERTARPRRRPQVRRGAAQRLKRPARPKGAFGFTAVYGRGAATGGAVPILAAVMKMIRYCPFVFLSSFFSSTSIFDSIARIPTCTTVADIHWRVA